MQSAVGVRAPFVAGAKASTRAARRPTVVLASAEQQPAWAVQRRSLAALLAAAPVVLSSRSALALIADDDDEEMVEKARANRKTRLASERSIEKEFTKAEGYTDRKLQKELVEVQQAVNSLALTGKQLASGEVAAAADTLAGAWAADFRRAAPELSANASARASVAGVMSDLTDLQASAQKGSVDDAKRSYVTLVGSLQGWVAQANLATTIKGL